MPDIDKLFMPTHPSSPFSHAYTRTHHQPDSSPPGLAQWACYIKPQLAGVQSRLDSCPNDTYIHTYIGEGVLGWCDFNPHQTRSYFWGCFYLCATFCENRSTVRVHIDIQTDTRTNTNWIYNLFRAICYSYGAGNYSVRQLLNGFYHCSSLDQLLQVQNVID